ncbi:phage tail tape measure protein [Clostridium baratii]
MSDEQLLVTLGVQDKGLNKQVTALNKELRYLDKEFKTTSKGSKDFEKSQDGLKTKLTYLEKKYDVQKNKLEVYKKQQKESSDRIKEKKEELEKLKNAEGDNTKAIEKAEKQLEKYKNQMRTATQNINLTEIEMRNLKEEISDTGDKMKSVPVEKLNKKLNDLEKEYKEVSSGSKEFEKSLDGLKTKQTYLTQKYDITKTKLEEQKRLMKESADKVKEKKEALDKLKNAEGSSAEAIQRAEKELENYKNKMESASKEVNRTEAELKELNREISSNGKAIKEVPIEEYKVKMEAVAQKAEKVSSKMKNAGESISNVGGNMMKASAPVLAFSGYAVKATMDFESAMSNVEAISGATGEDLKKLENKAKEMGRNTSKSAKDAADGMSYMALAGWNTKQMIEGIEPVLRLAEAGNLDLGRASDLTTDSLSALGLQVSDLTRYLDICTQAQRKSNTTADAMMEAYIACGGTMKNLKVPLAESATYIGILANRGKKGSEAGTALNSVMINLTSGAGQAGTAMKELGLSAFDSKGKFKGMNVVFKELNQKLSKCTEEQKNTYLAMIGGKTQIDTLNALLSGTNEEYGTLYNSIKNSDGALMDMAKTMQNNTKGNIDKLKSQLEGLGIQIGENLLPHINDFIGHLSKLIEWFGSLDESTQKNIIRFGLFTFAGGGVLKMIGSVTQGVGSLVSVYGKLAKRSAENAEKLKGLEKGAKLAKGGIGSLTKGIKILNPVTIGVTASIAALYGAMKVGEAHMKIMSKDILYTTDQMSGLEKAVAKFSNTGSKSKEELISMGLVYKDFSKNISPEFQKKVVESTNKINEFNMKLTEVNIDGKITKKEAEDLKNRVTDMCDGAISAIKSKQEESNKAMKELFLRDGVLDQSEKEMLESIKRNNNNQINEVNKLKKEILSIEQQALKEKRGLTEEEVKLIREKNNRIAQIELEAMGKSHEEMLYAQNEFQNRLNNISLEDASNLMKEKAKLRDEEYIKIKSAYDTNIALLEEHMAKVDGKEKENFKNKIEKLKKERDEKLKVNEDLYNGYLNTVKEKNPEIAAEINKFNGETLTAQDKTSQQLIEKVKSSYDNINQITESGNYLLLNNHTNTLESVSVKVDEKTGEIIGIYDGYSKSVAGYTTAVADDVKKMGQEHEVTASRIRNMLKDMETNTIDSAGNIVNANGKIVWSLQDVKNNADGTREGVLNLNGTPINIKADSNGAIRNLDEVKNKIENIPHKKTFFLEGVVNWVGEKIDKVKGFLGFAEGTNYAPPGVHMVGEEGYEIAQKGNKLGIVGINGPEFRRFRGGEKIIPHNKSVNMLKDVITSGGYFSPSSIQSRELISNVTNNFNNSYTNNSNTTNGSNTDMGTLIKTIGSELGIAIVNSMARCMQNANINLNADLNGLVNTVTPGVRSNISRTQKSRDIARGEI